MEATREFDWSDMSLEEFLKSRNIPEGTILKIVDEKITIATILIMPEEDLKQYFPKYGDRAAITNFCRRNSNSQKQSLIERIKLKIGNKPYQKVENKFEKKKKTRLIEIGWLSFNKEENRYRQVRTKYGGGTRKISIEKDSKCSEILELGKSLFFPNGTSTKGRLSSYNCELLDFKSHLVSLDLTVQDMYNISSLSTLRFYIATTLKNDEFEGSTSETDTFIPATTTRPSTSSINDNVSDRVLRSSTVDLRNPTITDYIESFNSYEETTGNGNFEEVGLDLDGTVKVVSATPYEYSIIDTDFSVYPLSENDMSENPYPSSNEENKLILHRGKVFEECVEALKIHNFLNFKTIKIEMILPNGVPENADDFGGVLRDAISEFWSDFYEKCTTGTNYKIPFLRHDFSEPEWRAISKFIVKGWESEGYFPIKIAPVFMKHCFGEAAEAEEILENFLEYICESDSNILKQGLQDFDNADYEELLECVSNYDSKWLPNKDNFRKLLTDIAHKEIIQNPAFVTRCFTRELVGSICKCDLKMIYNQLNPTVKNILSRLQVSETELNKRKVNIYGFLKKFVKEADEKLRSAFLRFCTGSDLVIKDIKVHFIESDGIARSPIAHTCTGLLELPVSYENFVDFRSEFNNLLNSKIWVMDIV